MQTEPEPGGYGALIVRAGMLSIESFPTFEEAVAHLRRWYARLISDPLSVERPYLITAMRNPYTATLAELQACYSQQDADQFWCDVVPLTQVVARLTPTFMPPRQALPHAALVLADGLVAAQPCTSYATALTALRTQATAWEHDDTILDPAQASIADLAALYCDEHAGQWLGIMPILLTEEGPAVLVPLDYLPATI